MGLGAAEQGKGLGRFATGLGAAEQGKGLGRFATGLGDSRRAWAMGLGAAEQGKGAGGLGKRVCHVMGWRREAGKCGSCGSRVG
ncbi:hypothetical protein ACS0TY_017867 [Phlomoides rotata]